MAAPIISIQDVSFAYPGDGTSVLNNLAVQFDRGDFCAIIGSNGCGKTSFCKLLTGLIPHYYQGDFSGSVMVAGLDAPASSVAELARKVGFVYQDFENQLIRPRVIDDVGFSALNYGYADYRERADRALSMLSIEHLRDKIIWELSGGEQHLVAMAGAVCLDPEILLIDEPISQLDPVNAKTVYDNLRKLNREYGKTIILVEHFTEFIGEYCNSVALFSEGSCLWKLPSEEALQRVDELSLNDIAPPQVTVAAFGTAGGEAGILPVRMSDAVEFFRRYSLQTRKEPRVPDESDGEVLVKLDSLSHTFFTIKDTSEPVLESLSLEFRRSERIALVGANGSGKSTLLKMIAGLIRPRGGEIIIDGAAQKGRSADELSEFISLVYQAPEQMFIEDSVARDIAYYPRSRKRENLDSFVTQLLEQFNLKDLADRDARLLSGGQMRRASLAVGAGMGPRILLLDEPTSSLDVQNRRQIVKMLKSLADQIVLTIIATHDMELVADWADRVLVLKGGACLADLKPRELFSDPQLMEQARIRPPQIVELSNRLGWTPAFMTPEELVGAATSVTLLEETR